MKTKNIYIWIVVVWIFIGCQSRLSTSTMADILVDISLAMNYTQEQIVSLNLQDTPEIISMKIKALDTICAIYKISPKELIDNYNYYIAHPLEMQIILDSMNQRVNKLLDLNNESIPKPSE
ncbi:MAG: DUF4296 domain-containing protein [Chitinophagaceae bacterium]